MAVGRTKTAKPGAMRRRLSTKQVDDDAAEACATVQVWRTALESACAQRREANTLSRGAEATRKKPA